MQVDRPSPDAHGGRLQEALGAARMIAWEFDVATGAIEYSGIADESNPLPRANDQEIAKELLEHALGGSGRFSAELRAVGPDGRDVWMRYQGDVIRDSEGKPARMTGVAALMSDPAETEELLRSIAAGVSVATGEAFFKLLVERLCVVLKTDSACVSAVDDRVPGVMRAFALFMSGEFKEGVEYPLSGTPCEKAIVSGRCFHARGVQAAFPEDRWLVEMGVESYLGVALTSSAGQPLGVMSVMSRSPMRHLGSAETILTIFASRASAELERLRNATDRKRVETELEEKDRFIRRIGETTLNVLFVYDLMERRNVYVNERGFDVLGYTAKEVRDLGGDFISRCMHPDDIAQLPQLAQDYARRADGEVFEHVFRMRHKDGSWRWVHRSATIFSRTPEGRPKEILGAVTDITRFKETEMELQNLSARLLDIQDEERRRIARELHDVTGQNLAALGFNLTVLGRFALESEATTILDDCQKLCEQSQKEIRTLSYLLHPPMLDEFGLIGALEWYVEGLKRRTSLDIVLFVQRGIGRLSSDLETDLFRVVQEALTNIVRYSGSASSVLRFELKGAHLVLRIEDQGCGLEMKADGSEIRFGVGIPGMRERLRQHGGTLEITSSENGTTLTVVVPAAFRAKTSGQNFTSS
jgi:PAS domain S-box-containing protein